MKVKIFRFAINESEGYEQKINDWLQAEGLKLEDVRIFQNYHECRHTMLVITIWYNK